MSCNKVLVNDLSAGTIAVGTVTFTVRTGYPATLRSSNLSGSGQVDLYYKSPNGAWTPSTNYDTETDVSLTSARPEVTIQVPGIYSAAVSVASSAAGQLWID